MYCLIPRPVSQLFSHAGRQKRENEARLRLCTSFLGHSQFFNVAHMLNEGQAGEGLEMIEAKGYLRVH